MPIKDPAITWPAIILARRFQVAPKCAPIALFDDKVSKIVKPCIMPNTVSETRIVNLQEDRSRHQRHTASGQMSTANGPVRPPIAITVRSRIQPKRPFGASAYRSIKLTMARCQSAFIRFMLSPYELGNATYIRHSKIRTGRLGITLSRRRDSKYQIGAICMIAATRTNIDGPQASGK